MLLPIRCPVCGESGGAPCPACVSRLRGAEPVLPRPAEVDSCVAALEYQGVGRELVARFKYRNARASAGFLAGAMAALVDRSTIEMVTWAPTTRARRRHRGYDQAQVLARAVARRLGLPVRGLLVRPPGPPQTGLHLTARRQGPKFIVRARRRPRGRVLLVDDVVTSGATVAAAALALKAAGATEVHAVVAARTPPPRPRARGGPLDSAVAVCGSVVESRGQSQAKRPT